MIEALMAKVDKTIHNLTDPHEQLANEERERMAHFLLRQQHNLEQTIKRLKLASREKSGGWAAKTLPYYSNALSYVKHMRWNLLQRKTRKLLSDFTG